ncbi:MAG: alpha/beta fold hydrolase [Acidimicrobiales bacterium]
MDTILVAGLWLDASVWDDVVERLGALGHRPVAVLLPGQGAPPTAAVLGDQLDAVLAAVDASVGPVMVVGHSAAGTLAWLAADARPEKVARVVMIGGFPSADGDTYADFFPVLEGVVPFPGWEPFEGPDAADLDDARRAEIAARAIPVPEGVAKGVVSLGDERRYDVPVTIVCPEFSAAQAREWVETGEVPELARSRRVDYVDIDSGHWPMFTRPAELAALLGGLANG